MAVFKAMISSQPTTGRFQPPKPLPRDQHHTGWNEALANALDQIDRPRGKYQVTITFNAVVDVTNPGNVVEYIVTLV
jgi:hypothetical protein